MKLNLEERLALRKQLGQVETGKIDFLQEVIALRQSLLIQPDEFETFGIVEGEEHPLKPGSAQVEKEIEISPEVIERVRSILADDEKEGKLQIIYVCLWKKFVGDGQDKKQAHE